MVGGRGKAGGKGEKEKGMDKWAEIDLRKRDREEEEDEGALLN